MRRRTKWIATGAVAVTALAAGSGIAVATSTEDDDPPIQGSALERASAIALEETGGGKVTGTEDEDGVYEIEVTLADGTSVDVELDHDFKVIGTEKDSESDDESGTDDDAGEAGEGADATNE